VDDEADREANDPRKANDCTEAVSVVDGGEHSDSEAEQDKAGYKPEGDKALPAIVDDRTVIGLPPRCLVRRALEGKSEVLKPRPPLRGPDATARVNSPWRLILT
jgi:hypothetical protein